MNRFKIGDRVRWLFHKHPPMYRVGVVTLMRPVDVGTHLSDIRPGVKPRVAHVEWDYLEKRHPNGVTTRTPCLNPFGWVVESALMHDDAISALGNLA